MSDLFVPASMIAAATVRRLAGDWRGACAAAMVDVDIDLDRERRRHGRAHADRLAADLAGFAPDLLRAYLPRREQAQWAGAVVVLSREEGRFQPHTRFLRVTLPPRHDGPQRLRLDIGQFDELPNSWHDRPAWCWHADAVDGRRWAYGASPTRLPWHTADGRPYAIGETTPDDVPRDRATEVETIVALVAAKRIHEAWAAAGIDLTGPQVYEWELRRHAHDLPRLAAEVRRLLHRYGLERISGAPAFTVDRAGRVSTIGHDRTPRPQPVLVHDLALLDVDQLRRGTLTRAALHPLVHRALFPGLDQPPPPEPEFALAVRVRCGGVWHMVRVEHGRVFTPHSDEEINREAVLAGFGGPMNGCGAAVLAWRTGRGRLPNEMRRVRQEVFRRAFHGDTDGLLRMLDGGLDPAVVDGQGRTLAHHLAHVDHTRLLPRLLAAGAPLDARDHEGRTPADRAAEFGASDVVAALACRPA